MTAPGWRVKLTVVGDCGHTLGVYYDAIDEKYPFWCDTCEDYHRIGKYPWSLKAEIMEGDQAPPGNGRESVQPYEQTGDHHEHGRH